MHRFSNELGPCEQWCDEKLAESVKGRFQVLGGYVKMIVGVLCCCVSIVGPALLLEELGEPVLIWIFLRSKKH